MFRSFTALPIAPKGNPPAAADNAAFMARDSSEVVGIRAPTVPPASVASAVAATGPTGAATVDAVGAAVRAPVSARPSAAAP